MNAFILPLKSALAFCFISILFVSCGGESFKNEAIINQVPFELDKAFIKEFGINIDGSFDWDLTLVSSGITFNTSLNDFQGTGAFLTLDLNSNSEAGLTDGTYEFATSRAEFTIFTGDVGTEVNFTTGVGVSMTVTDGSVTIKGDEIDFDLTLENGNRVLGNYTGELTSI